MAIELDNGVWSVQKILNEKNFFSNIGRGTSPRPFLKKIKTEYISWNQQSEVLYSLFLLKVQVEDYQSILKLRC